MGCDAYEAKWVRCRRPHRCSYCGEPIAAGEEALLEHGIDEEDETQVCSECGEDLDEGYGWEFCPSCGRRVVDGGGEDA